MQRSSVVNLHPVPHLGVVLLVSGVEKSLAYAHLVVENCVYSTGEESSTIQNKEGIKTNNGLMRNLRKEWKRNRGRNVLLKV